MHRAAGPRPPILLLAPAILVGAGMILPLVYLMARAAGADLDTAAALILRWRTIELVSNTLALVVAVLVMTTAIALPLALLIVRSDLRHKRLLSILAVLPLAIPGYVMAYALIGLSGHYGFFNQLLGLRMPRLEGLAGASIALTLYTFPYMFLNVRAALLGMDPALTETARSLGVDRRTVFLRVTLPHLKPALFSGWIVVALYVLGDFGTVALMRYEVFSYAIYNQYAGAFDRTYAAWLSLMLLALTASFLLAEGRLLKGRRLGRVGIGVARRQIAAPLGRARAPAIAFLGIVYAASIGLPLTVIVFWMTRSPAGVDLGALWPVALRTAGAAAPGAALAVIFALPVTLLAVRYATPLSRALERLVFVGYAIPPLAFALAFVFFALGAVPSLYQTLPLLVLAYALSFAALAVGPIRSVLLQLGTRTEEAARSLGRTALGAFVSVTLPMIGRSMVAGGLLVFVLVVKELPITFLLAPTGYTTLSMNIFGRTSEGMLADAAPYALATILFSSLFVTLMLRYEGRH